jgi:thiol-disulfide isomerase/thioredoxin
VVVIALLVVAALVLAASALGLLWRTTTGRPRRVRGPVVSAEEVGARELGARVTLLQLSTPMCTQCPPTARLLRAEAAVRPGVTHLEVDVSDRIALADRFRVLQTPTTLLLDADGRVRGRIGGRPRPEVLARELDLLLESPA